MTYVTSAYSCYFSVYRYSTHFFFPPPKKTDAKKGASSSFDRAKAKQNKCGDYCPAAFSPPSSWPYMGIQKMAHFLLCMNSSCRRRR